MPKQRKKKGKNITRLAARSKKRYLTGLAVVIMFGVLGSVLLLLVRANPYYVDECGRFHDPSTVWSSCAAQRRYAVGETMTIPIYANASISEYFTAGRPSTLHVNVAVYHTDSPVTYNNAAFSCGTAGGCTSGTLDSAYSYPATPSMDVVKCVQISPSKIGQEKVHLMTLEYTMGSGGRAGYEEGSYSIDVHEYWKPGNCGTNDAAGCGGYVQPAWCRGSRPLAAWGAAGTTGGCTANCEGEETTQEQAQKEGETIGLVGKTKGKQGGGGGGGSSATTQSTEHNRIPTSSAQGSRTQPQIPQPSPFYDGKLFAAGSEPVDSGGGPLTLVRRVTLRGWLYVSGVAVAGAAGYLFWRWKRKI